MCMIKSFADKQTEALWNNKRHKVAQSIASRALAKLQIINSAPSVEFMRVPPSNRLEVLSGDRQGQHSIRINDQWRICFRWAGRHSTK